MPYIVLPFFNFLAVLLCSLHVPLSLHSYCYSDAPWLWTFDIKLFILYKFYCFIHLPLFFIKFFSSIKILIFLYICFKLHLFDYDLFRKADKGVSFGNRQWILSVVSYKTFTRNVFEWMSNFHLAVFMVSFNFFPFAPAILVVFSSITKPAKSIITQFF